MELFDRRSEFVRDEVGVKLGGRQVRVPEQELETAEIHASLKEVGGEGVSKRVRGREPPQSGGERERFEDFPKRLSAQGAAPVVKKKKVVFGGEGGTAFFKVGFEQPSDLRRKGDDPFLVPFSSDPNLRGVEVHVLESEAYEFGDAETGCIENNQETLVSKAEGLATFGGFGGVGESTTSFLEKGFNLGLSEGERKAGLSSWGRQILTRVASEAFFPAAKLEKLPKGAGPAREAPGAQSPETFSLEIGL